MKHPGGSGAERWWPLAQWVGWPAYLKSWFISICDRESGGSPHVPNSEGSGCYGLMQLHPCHWLAKYGRVWIRDPLHQLWLAWQLYRGSGAAPWAL